MEIKSFTSVKATNMAINNLYALVAFVIEALGLAKDKLNVLILAVLADLEVKNAEMGSQLNKGTASGETPKIDAADKDRDGWTTEIKRQTETARKSRDATLSEAGAQMKLFLTPYWDLASRPLNTQSKDTVQLIEKYKANTDIQANATTIGIATMFTKLEEANNLVITLYQNRSDVQASNAGPSASSVKGPVAQTFNHLCSLILIAEAYTPSDELTSLYYKIENERKKYVDRSGDDNDEAPTTDETPTQS